LKGDARARKESGVKEFCKKWGIMGKGKGEAQEDGWRTVVFSKPAEETKKRHYSKHWILTKRAQVRWVIWGRRGKEVERFVIEIVKPGLHR